MPNVGNLILLDRQEYREFSLKRKQKKVEKKKKSLNKKRRKKEGKKKEKKQTTRATPPPLPQNSLIWIQLDSKLDEPHLKCRNHLQCRKRFIYVDNR